MRLTIAWLHCRIDRGENQLDVIFDLDCELGGAGVLPIGPLDRT
jgi:hypothetical protein